MQFFIAFVDVMVKDIESLPFRFVDGEKGGYWLSFCRVCLHLFIKINLQATQLLSLVPIKDFSCNFKVCPCLLLPLLCSLEGFQFFINVSCLL